MRYEIFFLLISCLQACSTTHSIVGFYENTGKVIGGYVISDMILRNDSTFTIRDYDDQIDYSQYYEGCGAWSMNKDSIQLTFFDTISYNVEYLPDSSGQLKLELFDSYDCPFLFAVFVFSQDQYLFDLNFGTYTGPFPFGSKNFTLVPINSPKFYQPIELRKDSMHIKVHGIFVDGAKSNSTLTLFIKRNKLFSKCPTCFYRKTIFYRKDSLTIMPTN